LKIFSPVVWCVNGLTAMVGQPIRDEPGTAMADGNGLQQLFVYQVRFLAAEVPSRQFLT